MIDIELLSALNEAIEKNFEKEKDLICMMPINNNNKNKGNFGVHFSSDEVQEMYEKNGGVKTEGSVGFDLIATKDYAIEPHQAVKIDLGIVIQPPEGYYVKISPRSSTFFKFFLFQTNANGEIDVDYNGKKDYCQFPAYNASDTRVVVPAGTPIAQAILTKYEKIRPYFFMPKDKSRGGFGSTDK